MSEMEARVVASDGMIWSGPATFVSARTVIGEIGILPHHEPVLALLDEGEVEIHRPDDDVLRVAVHRGFLSVVGETVTILADTAELAADIDLERAEAALARASAQADEDEEAAAAVRRAEVRIEVATTR